MRTTYLPKFMDADLHKLISLSKDSL